MNIIRHHKEEKAAKEEKKRKRSPFAQNQQAEPAVESMESLIETDEAQLEASVGDAETDTEN